VHAGKSIESQSDRLETGGFFISIGACVCGCMLESAWKQALFLFINNE